jgi:DNA modification methylase
MDLGHYKTGQRGSEWHGVYEGDSVELTKAIPDNSIDVIYSDPQYHKSHLPLYGWLATEAMRILRPDGFMLVMCGGLYINQIFRMIDDAGLSFFWKYEFSLTGSATGSVHPRGDHNPIIVRQKSILAYTKGDGRARTVTYGTMAGNGGDKQYHRWGQDVVSARYYIDCFSKEGDVCFDPFGGGGTTGIACGLINRRWLLFDQDAKAVATARARLTGQALPMFAGMEWEQRALLVG